MMLNNPTNVQSPKLNEPPSDDRRIAFVWPLIPVYAKRTNSNTPKTNEAIPRYLLIFLGN